MKLQLLITKREITHHKTITKTKYLFAVIDLDKSKQYPQNFVCMLPKTIYPKGKVQSKFLEKYGTQSKELCIKLLTEALKTTDDQDIKKELLARLKILNPKPKNTVKCNVCGKDFQSRKYRYGRQKTCHECKTKRYTVQS